jgi:peptidyl-dipeptidase Dcp
MKSIVTIDKLYGFTLTEEKDSTAFGKPLKEQRYELIVSSTA